jgi:hypothetical protein
MSALLLAAGIAVGTSVALLSLAYVAALSAYRGQALQDEELIRVWTRSPTRAQPIAAPSRRPALPAACAVIGNVAAKPRRPRPQKRAAR